MKPTLAKVLTCPHNEILVEDNYTIFTCQLCGAILKYVDRGGANVWSLEARTEFRKWLGPHWNKRKKVDWPATYAKMGKPWPPPLTTSVSPYGWFIGWVVLPIVGWSIIGYAVWLLL